MTVTARNRTEKTTSTVKAIAEIFQGATFVAENFIVSAQMKTDGKSSLQKCLLTISQLKKKKRREKFTARNRAVAFVF